jgi:hypothetical protein
MDLSGRQLVIVTRITALILRNAPEAGVQFTAGTRGRGVKLFHIGVIITM